MSGKQSLPAWKSRQLQRKNEELFECPSPRVGTWAVKKASRKNTRGLGPQTRPGAQPANAQSRSSKQGKPAPSTEFDDHQRQLLAKLDRKLVLQRKPNRATGLRKHHFKAAPEVINTTKLGPTTKPRTPAVQSGPTTDIERVLSAPSRLRVRGQLSPFGTAPLPVQEHRSKPEEFRKPPSDPSIAAGGRAVPKQSDFAMQLQRDLPRSVYIVDEELPTRTGNELVGERAKSRWNLPNGKGVRWRKCTIVAFDQGSDTYSIRWDFKRGGPLKSVRRSNLLLSGEDESTLKQFYERRQRQVRAMEASAAFKFLRDSPLPSRPTANAVSRLDAAAKANILRLSNIDIKAEIPYAKATILQDLFMETNDDFERAMKVARAESIWIATHVNEDCDTSLFAVRDYAKRHRFDIGTKFDVKACKRALGAVNRKLSYKNRLMAIVSQMAQIPVLPVAPWSPGPLTLYKFIRKGLPVPTRSEKPFELPYTLDSFTSHFSTHFAEAEAILLNVDGTSPKRAEASLLTKTADLLLDFYVQECDRLSRKYMENRKAKQGPFIRTLFLANQLRWDVMKNSIAATLQSLKDLVSSSRSDVCPFEDSLGLRRFDGDPVAAYAAFSPHKSGRRPHRRLFLPSNGNDVEAPDALRTEQVAKEEETGSTFLTSVADDAAAQEQHGGTTGQAQTQREQTMLSKAFDGAIYRKLHMLVDDGYFHDIPAEAPSLFAVDIVPVAHGGHSSSLGRNIELPGVSTNSPRGAAKPESLGESPLSRGAYPWGFGVKVPPTLMVLRFEPSLEDFVAAIESQVDACVSLGAKLCGSQVVDVVLLNKSGHMHAPKIPPIEPGSGSVKAIKNDVRAGLADEIQKLKALKAILRKSLAQIVVLDEAQHHKFVGTRLSKLTASQRLIQWSKEIQHIRSLRDTLKFEVPAHIFKVGPIFSVDLSKLKVVLSAKLKTLWTHLLEQFARELKQQCQTCENRYAPAVKHLRTAATTFDEYDALQRRLAKQAGEIECAWNHAASLWQQLQLLQAHHWDLPNEDFSFTTKTIAWPQALEAAEEFCREKMPEYHAMLSELLTGQLDHFDLLVNEFEQGTFEMTELGLSDVAGADMFVQQATNLHQRLIAARDDSRELNRCREILGSERLDYELVNRLIALVSAVQKLWQTQVTWTEQDQKWRSASILSLGDVDEHIRKHQRELFTVRETLFGGDPRLEPALKLHHAIAASIKDFSRYLPLIRAMHTPGLVAKHRAEIVATLGVDLEPGVVLTLNMMIEMDALAHVESIVNICSLAGLEHSIRSELAAMQEAWRVNTLHDADSPEHYTQLRLVLGTFDACYGLDSSDASDHHAPLAHHQRCILALDKLIAATDCQLNRCRDILLLPYGQDASEDISAWIEVLVHIENALRKLEDAQRQWCEMALFYGHPFVIKSIPHLLPYFAEANEVWSKIMLCAMREPRVPHLARQESTFHLVDDFFEAIRVARAGCTELIHRHARKCPRMYALSTQDVIDLFTSRSTQHIVDSTALILPQLFPGISRLELSDRRAKCQEGQKGFDRADIAENIVAVCSRSGRLLPLREPISLRVTAIVDDVEAKESESRAGTPAGDSDSDIKMLPVFLNTISNAVDTTLKKSLELALCEAVKMCRSPTFARSFHCGSWLLAWPPQVVIAIKELIFTQHVERALQMSSGEAKKGSSPANNVPTAVSSEDKRKQALELILSCLQDNIEALFSLKTRRTTSACDHFTIDAALVLTMHHKSIVNKLLLKVDSLSADPNAALHSFEWLVQRRVYMINPEYKPDAAKLAAAKAEEQAMLQQMTESERLQYLDDKKTNQEAEKNGRSHFSFELDSDLETFVQNTGYMMNCHVGPASRQFGFEYLGDAPRMPITAGTLRATHTLFRAFHLGVGVNVTGLNSGTVAPATIGDIAASLGTHCHSTVCSQSETAHTILAFVKASAALGWWCFLQGVDNVSSFTYGRSSQSRQEMYSFLALVAKSILPVIDAGKVKICKMLDDTPVTVQPTFAFLISQNVGVRSRFNTDTPTALPEHIQDQFRTLALVQPHLHTIANVRLLCEGFESPATLATKLVRSLQCVAGSLSRDGNSRVAAAVGDVRMVLKIITEAALLRQNFLVEKLTRKQRGPQLPSKPDPSMLAEDNKVDEQDEPGEHKETTRLYRAIVTSLTKEFGGFLPLSKLTRLLHPFFRFSLDNTVTGEESAAADSSIVAQRALQLAAKSVALSHLVRRSLYPEHSVVIDGCRAHVVNDDDILRDQAQSDENESNGVNELFPTVEAEAGLSCGQVKLPFATNYPASEAVVTAAVHESLPANVWRLYQMLYCETARVQTGLFRPAPVTIASRGSWAAHATAAAAKSMAKTAESAFLASVAETNMVERSQQDTDAASSGLERARKELKNSRQRGGRLRGALVCGVSAAGKTLTIMTLAHALLDPRLIGTTVVRRRVQVVRVFPDAFSVEALLGREELILANGKEHRFWKDGLIAQLLHRDQVDRESARECWLNRVRLSKDSSSNSSSSEKEDDVGSDDGSDDSEQSNVAAPRRPSTGSKAATSSNVAASSCPTPLATWIVFDGATAAYWVEGLLHHLRTDHALSPESERCCEPSACLRSVSSGLPEAMPSTQMRLLFETDDLGQCSPALLDHFGILHLGTENSDLNSDSSALCGSGNGQFGWAGIVDAFMAEVDIFAQIAYQEFQRCSAAHLARRRHAKAGDEREGDPALGSVLQSRFHLKASLAARTPATHPQRPSSSHRRMKRVSSSRVVTDTSDGDAHIEFDLPDEESMTAFASKLRLFFGKLFTVGLAVLATRNRHLDANSQLVLALEFTKLLRIFLTSLAPRRVKGHFCTAANPTHLRVVARKMTQRCHDDNVGVGRSLSVEETLAAETDAMLDFMQLSDAATLAKSTTDFLDGIALRVRCWSVMALIWSVGAKATTEHEQTMFHDALCSFLKDVSNEEQWASVFPCCKLRAKDIPCFQWLYDATSNTFSWNASQSSIDAASDDLMDFSHTRKPHFYVSIADALFVPVNSIVKNLFRNGNVPIIVADDLVAAQHLQRRIAATLPEQWCVESNVFVEEDVNAEVLANELLSQCVQQGNGRMAVPGRSRLLLLLDDVSAPSDRQRRSASSVDGCDATDLLRQLFECRTVPSADLLSLGSGFKQELEMLLGGSKASRFPSTRGPDFMRGLDRSEIDVDVVNAAAEFAGQFRPRQLTLDDDDLRLAGIGSVGYTVSNAYIIGTATSEVVGRSRQHCFHIFVPELSNSDHLDLILQQTASPLFGERRLEVEPSAILHSSVQSIIGPLSSATAELFRWVKQHFEGSHYLLSGPSTDLSSPATLPPHHFAANRNHLSRILRGIAGASSEFIENERGLLRAWLHECGRVFEDQLTTLQNIQEYRKGVTRIMETALHCAFPSNKLAAPRRGLVSVHVEKENALLVLFQRLVQHKLRRALLFWRAFAWQTPTDVGACQELFFAPSSKSLLDTDNDHREHYWPQNMLREEPKLQFQIILSDLVHMHNEQEIQNRIDQYHKGKERRRREQAEREERRKARLSRKDRYAAAKKAQSTSAVAEAKKREQLEAAKEKMDLQQLREPPLQLRLFDSVVSQAVRVLRAITNASSQAVLLIGPPAVGKWSIVHLVSLVTKYKLLRFDVEDITSSLDSWRNWMLNLMEVCVAETVVGGPPIVVYLKGVDEAPEFCLRALLRAITTGQLPRTAEMNDILLSRLHASSFDGLTRSAAARLITQRLSQGLRFVFTAVNDTVAASQTSQRQSVTGAVVRIRSEAWTRLVSSCQTMWVHPWPSSNLSTFSVEVLRKKIERDSNPSRYFILEQVRKHRPAAVSPLAHGAAKHSRHATMPSELLLSTKQKAQQQDVRRLSTSEILNPNGKPSRQPSDKSSHLLTAMQAEVTARIEYCAALMHHLAVSMWGSHMIAMSLLERCVELFWRLLHSVGPNIFLSFNKCSETVDRYDEAIRSINENTSLLKREEPVLQTKIEEQSRLAEVFASSADETSKQEDRTTQAKEAAAEQKRVSSRLREEIRNLYATVDPAVSIAMRSVRSLKQTSLDEIRLMPSAPYNLKLALAGLCVMLGEAPDNDPTLPLVDAYWEPAMGLISDASDLITMLTAYRKEAIPDIIMNRIAGEPFIANPDFDFRKMRKTSPECETFVCWIHAMFRYSMALRSIRPLEAQAEESDNILSEKRGILRQEAAKLEEREEVDKNARAELRKITAEVERLEQLCAISKDKLYRAQKIQRLFKSQYPGWVEMKDELEVAAKCLHGDLLIAAGTATYLGVADFETRNRVANAWARALSKEKLPTTFSSSSTNPFGIDTVLAKEQVVFEWCNDGLPLSRMAVENVVIMHMAQEDGRWPVVVDTYGIARRWIQKHYTPTMEQRLEADRLQRESEEALKGMVQEVRLAAAAEKLAAQDADPELNSTGESTTVSVDTIEEAVGSQTKVFRPTELREINTRLSASEVHANVERAVAEDARIMFDTTFQSVKVAYDLRQSEVFNLESDGPEVSTTLKSTKSALLLVNDSNASSTAQRNRKDGEAILTPQLHFVVQSSPLAGWRGAYTGSLCPIVFTQSNISGRELESLFRDLVVNEVAREELQNRQKAVSDLLQLKAELQQSKISIMEEFLGLSKENFDEVFRRMQATDAHLLPLHRQMRQLESQISTWSKTIAITEPLVKRLVQLFDAAQHFSKVGHLNSVLYPVSIDTFAASARESIRTRLRALHKQRKLDERARQRAREKEELGNDGSIPRLRKPVQAKDDTNDDDDTAIIRGFCTPTVMKELVADITMDYFERKILAMGPAHLASFAILVAPRLDASQAHIVQNNSGKLPKVYVDALDRIQRRELPSTSSGVDSAADAVSDRAEEVASAVALQLSAAHAEKMDAQLKATISERARAWQSRQQHLQEGHKMHTDANDSSDEEVDGMDNEVNTGKRSMDAANERSRLEVEAAKEAFASQLATQRTQRQQSYTATREVPTALQQVIPGRDWQLLRLVCFSFWDTLGETDGNFSAMRQLPYVIANNAPAWDVLLRGSPHAIPVDAAESCCPGLPELGPLCQFLVLTILRPDWTAILSLRLLRQICPETTEKLARLKDGWSCREVSTRLSSCHVPICLTTEDMTSLQEVDAAIEAAARAQKTKLTCIDFGVPFASNARSLVSPSDWVDQLASTLDRGFLSGTWVVLKNIHALSTVAPAPGKSTALDVISFIFTKLRDTGDKVAKTFRLWLTFDIRTLAVPEPLRHVVEATDDAQVKNGAKNNFDDEQAAFEIIHAKPPGPQSSKTNTNPVYQRVSSVLGIVAKKSILVHHRNVCDLADSVYNAFLSAGSPFFGQKKGKSFGGAKKKTIRGFHGQKLVFRLLNFYARMLHARRMQVSPWATRSAAMGGWNFSSFLQVVQDITSFDESLESSLHKWMDYVMSMAFADVVVGNEACGRTLRLAAQTWRIRKIQGVMPSEVDKRIRLIAGQLALQDTHDMVGLGANGVGNGEIPYPVCGHPRLLDIVLPVDELSFDMVQHVAELQEYFANMLLSCDRQMATLAEVQADVDTPSWLNELLLQTIQSEELLLRTHLHIFTEDCKLLINVLCGSVTGISFCAELLRALTKHRVPQKWWRLPLGARAPARSPIVDISNGGMSDIEGSDGCGQSLWPWITSIREKLQYLQDIIGRIAQSPDVAVVGAGGMPLHLGMFTHVPTMLVKLAALLCHAEPEDSARRPELFSGGFIVAKSVESADFLLQGLVLQGAEWDQSNRRLLKATSPYYFNHRCCLSPLAVQCVWQKEGDARELPQIEASHASLSWVGSFSAALQVNGADSVGVTDEVGATASNDIYRCPVLVHSGHASEVVTFVDVTCGGDNGLSVQECIEREVALFLHL